MIVIGGIGAGDDATLILEQVFMGETPTPFDIDNIDTCSAATR